ncbi:lipase [Hydrogenophaga crassostreae]|uniref:lipase n=1 Tax=Hydrogenophaga crassostreae TaxID=1763535 RepID=UPI000B328300|nr:lipase [Hydrogenophaga crassostreae]
MPIGQHRYKILDHADNPRTGYQGTIYQRVDTGEIIVAHRGTEFDREALKDGLLADGGMVFNRSNLQVPDAIELTRKALHLANSQASDFNGHPPPVTVTGHSLGGTLAQVTAHHFDLKGETFNAYGAHSLGLRIPEGGNAVTNHVMAGDMVSAGSGHYGQVKVYAEPQEITGLATKGFDNTTHWSDRLRGYSPVNFATGTTPHNTLGAAISLADSHKMHHFVNTNSAGKPDHSVLNDSAAIERAQTNATAIDEYRGNVRSTRGSLTAVSRNPVETVIDSVNFIRGPLPPGEPARLEELENKRHSSAPARAGAGTLSPTSHSLLEASERHVRQVAEQHGLPWNTGLDNTAHAIAASARGQGMSDINLFRVADGQIRYGQLDGAMLKDGVLNARHAANQPMADSLERLGQLDQQQQQDQLATRHVSQSEVQQTHAHEPLMARTV